MAAVIGSASPASAKPKDKAKPAKQIPRTWRAVAEYVLKNGVEDSIKAPTARNIGYDADVIVTFSLGIEEAKSKDGREHNFEVVYSTNAKGVKQPKEIIIGTMLVKDSPANKEIDGYEIRLTLDGNPIRGMRATGIVGQVVQQVLPPDSKDLQAVLKAEKSLYLKEIELAQLTQ